ncbi:hypothetical protein OG711_07740 [Streptomyces uncialis]|nr:hypothetical protein [Streptomyces uncialis]
MTGKGFCERPLSGPHPGSVNECASCRRRWEEAEVARQIFTCP